MPVKTDPFGIATDVKAAYLLAVTGAALKNGADFCFAMLHFVREEKFFASSRGSAIFQTRLRGAPSFMATAVDKSAGKFASRDDGVRTSGAEFPIVENGIFKNYQMAAGYDSARSARTRAMSREAAHALMSARCKAAAISSGNSSGVHAKTGQPSAAKAAA